MPKGRQEQPTYSREMGFDMRMAYDSSNREEYVGYAFAESPAAKDSESKWQIMKLAYNTAGGVTHRRYADGSDDFDKTWENRTSYIYQDI